MKTCFLLFFLSLLSNLAYAQALSTEWVKSIPGNAFEQNSSVAQAPCGDIYTVGFFQGSSFGPLSAVGLEEGFISKYNAQGQLIWVKQLAGSSTNRINGIAIGSDDEIYIVGEFRGTFRYNTDSLVSFNQLDVLVAKVDSSGHFEWAASATGWGYESAYDISLSPNGNVLVTGYYENDLNFGSLNLFANNLRDIFIMAIDQQGNPLWLESLSGPGVEYTRSIATDTSNNIYLTGVFRDYLYPNGGILSGFGDYDAFLAKYDPTGQLLWIKALGGPYADEGYCVNVDQKQDIVLVGWYDQSILINNVLLNGSKEEDCFVAKFSPNGDLVWAIPLAGSFDERIYALDFDANNDIYLLGTLDSVLVIDGDSLTNRHLNRPTDIFIIKLDKDGRYKWGQTLGHYYNDLGYDLVVQDPTTLYIVGSFQDTSIFIHDTLISQAGYDIFVGKFNIDTMVSVQKVPNQAVSDISQIELYPNPAVKGKSTLEYTLTQTSNVVLSVYDILGQKLSQHILKDQSVGIHQTKIQLPSAAALYFVRLETENQVEVLELICP